MAEPVVQEIAWIVLPNGFAANGAARASILVSPRLSPAGGDGTLAAFDFADWPAAVARQRFELQFGDRTLPATLVGGPDSTAWRALFPADTPVRGFVSDDAGAAFASYSGGRVQDQVERLYAGALPVAPDIDSRPPQVAASLRDFAVAAQSAQITLSEPSATGAVDPLITAIALIAQDAEDADAGAAQLERTALAAAAAGAGAAEPAFVPLVPDSPDEIGAFAQFAAFHQVGASAGRRRQAAAAATPALDFHQRLTTLGDYPALQRRLGLVLDLEFDAAALADVPAGSSATLFVSSIFTGAAVPTRETRPPTAYRLERGILFAAAPEPDSDVSDGLVELGTPDPATGAQRYRLLEIDVDAAGLQILSMVGALRAGAADASAGPPALRTVGLSLTRAGQAERLHADIGRVRRRLGAAQALTADDLMRGYRVDVQQGGGPWRSLHQRRGTYRLTGTGATIELDDEGAISPAIGQSEASPEATQHALHDGEQLNMVSDTLFTWAGWSLSAPQPGRRDATIDPAARSLPLDVAFTPLPASLPTLRFGDDYRFRLRSVDLAGNALPIEAADAELARRAAAGAPLPVLPASAPLRFLRCEPVGAPGQSEPVDRLVLRGSAEPQIDLLPPRATARIAEFAAAFDDAIRLGNDLEGAHAILARAFARSSAGGAPSGLADPMAGGVALRGVPGLAENQVALAGNDGLESLPNPLPAAFHARFGSLLFLDFAPAPAWPDLAPVRLRLVAGDAPPQWDPASHTLLLALPPAASRELWVSSLLARDEQLEQFLLWDWLKRQLDGTGEALATARAFALFGQHWALTPARRLTLVHAVDKPVEAPVLSDFAVPVRRIGETLAFLGGRITLHTASTGRAELHASWADMIDRGEPGGPTPVASDVLVASIPLDGTEPPASFPVRVANDGPHTIVSFELLPLAAQEAALLAAIDSFDAAAARLRNAAEALRPHDPGIVAAVADAFRADGIGGNRRRPPLYARLADWIAYSDTVVANMSSFIPPTDDEFPDDPSFDRRLERPARSVKGATNTLRATARFAQAVLALPHAGQDFGDPRRREVTYEVRAISRFAGEFPPDDTPGAFTIASNAVTVTVPSSARPPAPHVRAVVPTFVWTRTEGAESMRERRSALRVLFDRPWDSSGDGELLGVVTAQGVDSFEPAPRVSQWARDPVFRSDAVPDQLLPEHLRGGTTVLANLQPAETEGVSSLHVTVVGYEVMSEQDGTFFCDIDLAETASYAPFVRLALCRLQPIAVPGTEISPIVVAEAVPLPPTRRVAVRMLAGGCTVTVAGIDSRRPSPADPQVDVRNRFVASLQRRVPGATDEAGWTAMDGGGEIVETDTTDALWSAQVTLAAPPEPGSVRLLIEEMEIFSTLGGLGSAEVIEAQRTVFADVVVF